jgi:hypothetical protein
MAVTAVGSLATTNGTGNVTFSVTTTTIGNCVILGVRTNSISLTVSSISGSGVTWSSLGSGFVSSGRGRTYEIWLGLVTSVVSGATHTVTWSGDPSAKTQSYSPQEFTNGSGAATTWALDGAQYAGREDNTTSTTINWPTLTSGGLNRVYFGKGSQTSGTPTGAGSPAGFVYSANTDMWCYGFVNAGSISPTSVCGSTTATGDVAALIVPTPPPVLGPTPYHSYYGSYF